jgi:hypothetical protein
MSEAPPVDPAGMPPTLRQYRQWEAEGRITRPLTDRPLGPHTTPQRGQAERHSRHVDHIHALPDIQGHTRINPNAERFHIDELGVDCPCPPCSELHETIRAGKAAKQRRRHAAAQARINGGAPTSPPDARRRPNGTYGTPKPTEDHTA